MFLSSYLVYRINNCLIYNSRRRWPALVGLRLFWRLPDISYPNLFVPSRFVPQKYLTLALTLTLTLALTRNSNTNT